jgi:hypothetical protein
VQEISTNYLLWTLRDGGVSAMRRAADQLLAQPSTNRRLGLRLHWFVIELERCQTGLSNQGQKQRQRIVRLFEEAAVRFGSEDPGTFRPCVLLSVRRTLASFTVSSYSQACGSRTSNSRGTPGATNRPTPCSCAHSARAPSRGDR